MGSTYQVKIKKFKTNPLLERKQFVLEVFHHERPSVPKITLQEHLAKLYKVPDPKCIILFGFKTHFGGGRSTGFGLIYDNIISCKKFEPRYRLARHKLIEKSEKTITRRGKKDIKNRQKKVRGKEKAKIAGSMTKK